MPLPTMPTQPAQLLDPAEFKPFGKAGKPKAGQEPRKPVPALEREALSETGRAQPKRSTARARSGEASPMAKEDARQRPTIATKTVDRVPATDKSTETAARRRARRRADDRRTCPSRRGPDQTVRARHQRADA